VDGEAESHAAFEDTVKFNGVPVLATFMDLAAGAAPPVCESNVNATGVTANCGAGVTFKVTTTAWVVEPAGGVKVSVPEYVPTVKPAVLAVTTAFAGVVPEAGDAESQGALEVTE
jgi:hypothetical protein